MSDFNRLNYAHPIPRLCDINHKFVPMPLSGPKTYSGPVPQSNKSKKKRCRKQPKQQLKRFLPLASDVRRPMPLRDSQSNGKNVVEKPPTFQERSFFPSTLPVKRPNCRPAGRLPQPLQPQPHQSLPPVFPKAKTSLPPDPQPQPPLFPEVKASLPQDPPPQPQQSYLVPKWRELQLVDQIKEKALRSYYDSIYRHHLQQLDQLTDQQCIQLYEEEFERQRLWMQQQLQLEDPAIPQLPTPIYNPPASQQPLPMPVLPEQQANQPDLASAIVGQLLLQQSLQQLQANYAQLPQWSAATHTEYAPSNVEIIQYPSAEPEDTVHYEAALMLENNSMSAQASASWRT